MGTHRGVQARWVEKRAGVWTAVRSVLSMTVPVACSHLKAAVK
ncbi:hypothetical protein [Streptomyces candidus]|uniref:Uncharacterized protein n=1 Tax=Streptomyces candidus TaxID=67283 RepID=A0A7X0LTS0_9ACTN|nr:hypothetical protein [Streptomyces candidus]MBB6439694.1 hypothetical protein [Streptomyces candidus]